MQQIRIDFDNPGLPQGLGVVEGESQSRIFQIALYKSGAAYTAPAGAVYSIMYRGFGPQNQGWYDTIEDGAGKRAACTVSGNIVTCELARQALRVPGHLTVVLCVSDAKGYMLKSWPIMADVRNDGYEDTGESEMYFNLSGIAGNYLTQLEKAMTEAEATKNNLISISTQAQKDIDAKAAETLKTIPESYTELDGSVKKLKENVADINSRFSRHNLFDKDTASIVDIMCNDSLVFISPGVQSIIWKCEPNTTYTISWTGISGNNRYIIYTSTEKPIVDKLSKALRKIEMSNTVSGSNRHYTTITTTSEENYLLLYFWMYASGGNATLDTMQISTGNRLLDYVPYSDYEMPNLKLAPHQFDGITINITNCTDEMANLLGHRNLGALDKGYICLVADDGYAKVSNVTFPIAKEKNIPITLALWTDSEVVTNPTLLAELRTMIANNNIGICQHGVGHFTDYSPKELYNYLISEKDKWGNLSLNVAGVAYPNHSRNEQVRTICGALYGVCCSGGPTRPMVYSHDTNGARSNIFDLYRISLYSENENYLKGACDFANSNKKLVIIFWHDSDIYGDADQINKLKNVIDYAKTIGLTFVNVGDIPQIN